MLHFAVCEDEEVCREGLVRELEAWAREEQEVCSVEQFPTADAFLFAWEERKDTDVLLLDIEMPGMDGMALAKKLRGMGERLGIIFVTGNPEFALEGYDLEAVSYIVKPIKRERLHMALNRARERGAHREAILAPLSAGEVEKVYLSDICCLEGSGHETLIWKRDGGSLSCRTGLRQMEQEIEERSEAFFKPHSSFLINLGRVDKIGKKEIRMENRMLVPVARGKWEPLNQAYMAYFRREARREAD